MFKIRTILSLHFRNFTRAPSINNLRAKPSSLYWKPLSFPIQKQNFTSRQIKYLDNLINPSSKFYQDFGNAEQLTIADQILDAMKIYDKIIDKIETTGQRSKLSQEDILQLALACYSKAQLIKRSEPKEAISILNKAIPLLESYAIDQKVLVHCYIDLGYVYTKINNWSEALRSFQKALETATKIAYIEMLPEIHKRLVSVKVNLEGNRSKEAVEHSEKSLAYTIQIYGESHDMTRQAYYDLGVVLWAQEKNQEAEFIFSRVLDIMDNDPRSDKSSFADHYTNIAAFQVGRGKINEAYQNLKKASGVIGTIQDPSKIATVIRIAEGFNSQNDFESSLKLLKKALNDFSGQHSSTLQIGVYYVIAVTYAKMDRLDEGIEYAEEALSQFSGVEANTESFTIKWKVYILLAELSTQKKDLNAAKMYNQMAIEHYLQNPTLQAASTVKEAKLIQVYDKLGRIHLSLNEYVESIDADKKVLEYELRENRAFA